MRKLKYVGGYDEQGQAKAFIPGVPASDHTCTEAEAEERLRSGLYEDVTPKKKDEE